MNILLLSCGTRNKLIRYFKETKPEVGKVAGTDCSIYAPALYEADVHAIVPRMTEPDYLSTILAFCEKEQLDAVLPLQEDELSLIASRKALFTDRGILPVISQPEAIELCRDKYAFFQHLKKHGLPVLETCRGLDEFHSKLAAGQISFPVFLKPERGCGSIGIQKVTAPELLEVLYRYREEEMILQQFADGEEFGADIYVDLLSHKPTAIFTKKKLRMRAGETEKSISIKDPVLFELIERTVSTLPLAGPIDMDIFKVKGQYYISEINPRFGGGYPHAYSCGVNFPRMLAHNAAGQENPVTIGNYEEGICMLKYTDLLTFRP